MINIISYSGGAGSAITAELVLEKYGNIELLFADSLMEDEDLYRFNDDVARHLGVTIKVIAEGRTPWEVFRDVKYQGNTRVDPCSRVLKRDFIRAYLENNYSSDNCQVWIGIDCSEEHRLAPVVERNKPFVYRSHLIENDIFIDTEYKINWCKERGIKPPRMYELGFQHNNCGGMCVKAGQAQFKLLYEKMPDVYLWNEEQQEALMKEVPNVRPFLRKTMNGKLHYLTLRQYREMFLDSKSNDIDLLDFGGCGCAL